MASSSNNICATELCRRSAAAAGASFLSIIVTTPFDVIKTRMISQAAALQHAFATEAVPSRLAIAACPNMCYQGPVASIKASALCPPTCNIYHSTTDAMRKMMRQEGVRAFWRGTRETLLMAVPMVGLYLPLYETLLNHMSPLGHAAPVVAGATARTFSMFCVAPIDIFRVRLQSLRQGAVGNGMMSSMDTFDWGRGRSLFYRTSVLWTGFGATVIRDVPFTSVYWGLLEPIRKSLLPKSEKQSLTDVVLANSFAGFVAGTMASVMTQPMDVLKTRMQLAQSTGPRPRYLDLCRHMYKTEGIRGFFAGFVPRIWRVGPSCAIVISTYELLKEIL